MADTFIDIHTSLSLEDIVKKFQEVTIDKASSQTYYHQIYKGTVSNDGIKIHDIYATNRNLILYELKFIKSVDNSVTVRVTNNLFDQRQIISALMKAFLLPFGFVLIFLAVYYYSDLSFLIFQLGVASLFIVVGLAYKPKPLTKKDYLSDSHVQNFIKLINGRPQNE